MSSKRSAPRRAPPGGGRAFRAAGYDCTDFRQAEYTCKQAKQAGYSALEAKAAGWKLEEIIDAGYAVRIGSPTPQTQRLSE